MSSASAGSVRVHDPWAGKQFVKDAPPASAACGDAWSHWKPGTASLSAKWFASSRSPALVTIRAGVTIIHDQSLAKGFLDGIQSALVQAVPAPTVVPQSPPGAGWRPKAWLKSLEKSAAAVATAKPDTPCSGWQLDFEAEVVARVTHLEKAVRAQVAAQRDGFPVHSARPVLSRDENDLQTAAKHHYANTDPFVTLSAADARRANRGSTLCRFFPRGECKYGDRCWHAHCADALQKTSDDDENEDRKDEHAQVQQLNQQLQQQQQQQQPQMCLQDEAVPCSNSTTEAGSTANAQVSDLQHGDQPASVEWHEAISKEQLVELCMSFARERPREAKLRECVRLCRSYIVESRGLYSWEQLHGKNITDVIRSTLDGG